MIKLKTKQEIILKHFREEKSIREVAAETGISRPTVTKYVNAYKEAQENLNYTTKGNSVLIEEIVNLPRYNSTNRKSRKFTYEMKEVVLGYLKENQQKIIRGQSKQQMKKIDIHEALQNQGYQISYSTLCERINIFKERFKETYIKQKYSPGEICEFDWGKVKLIIDGKLRRLSIAVFTSAYSNYRYAIVLPKEDMTSFIHAHVNFFKNTGGVFKRMDYDNLATAVKRFRGRSDRELTDDFMKMSIYYQFKSRFCNIAKGNEKGHVERSVEYVRRKAFCINDKFDNIIQVNDYLLSKVNSLNQQQLSNRKKSAKELFEEEQPFLYKTPVNYEYAETDTFRVDKYSTISVKTCHYSVPEKYNGRIVIVKIFPLKIIVYNNHEIICTHNRNYGFNEWVLDINHYLSTLKKKPGSVSGSYALHQSCMAIKNLYNKYFKESPREFIDLLELIKKGEISFEKAENAILQLIKIGSFEITVDKIKMICLRKEREFIYDDKDEILKHCQHQLNTLSELIPNKETLLTNGVIL